MYRESILKFGHCVNSKVSEFIQGLLGIVPALIYNGNSTSGIPNTGGQGKILKQYFAVHHNVSVLHKF